MINLIDTDIYIKDSKIKSVKFKVTLYTVDIYFEHHQLSCKYCYPRKYIWEWFWYLKLHREEMLNPTRSKFAYGNYYGDHWAFTFMDNDGFIRFELTHDTFVELLNMIDEVLGVFRI